MSFSNPIVEAGVAGLARLYADRAVTPVEACEAYISRIGRLDGALGAYVHVDAEGARTAAHESAERWSRGAALSLLDGQPIAVKANIAVAGLPWHAGLAAYQDRIAEEDAACIARLREAGAVILGLLNMSEGAFGGTMDNPWFGRTHNPWSRDHTPGSSSGGSGAAVAAGLCSAALGTDTSGSVRVPAALTGVFGHKPTMGLIATEGVVPVSWTFDHVGLLARSAEDCAHMLAGAAGAEAELAAEIAQPATAETLRGAPLAALVLDGLVLDDQVAEAFEQTLAEARDLGLEVEMVRLSGYDFDDLSQISLIIAAEASVEHAQALADNPQGFSPVIHERLRQGRERSASDLARAYHGLAGHAELVRAQLSPFAGLLTPATPRPAPPYGPDTGPMIPFTALANVLGLPATVFPVGVCDDGRPLGVQAIAWDDETSLGLARMLGRDLGAPPAAQG
jgi:aspartyl-tRNA(Asn)/glutamyl-tRNA(Gln) amidotransferase subunit A